MNALPIRTQKPLALLGRSTIVYTTRRWAFCPDGSPFVLCVCDSIMFPLLFSLRASSRGKSNGCAEDKCARSVGGNFDFVRQPDERPVTGRERWDVLDLTASRAERGEELRRAGGEEDARTNDEP